MVASDHRPSHSEPQHSNSAIPTFPLHGIDNKGFATHTALSKWRPYETKYLELTSSQNMKGTDPPRPSTPSQPWPPNPSRAHALSSLWMTPANSDTTSAAPGPASKHSELPFQFTFGRNVSASAQSTGTAVPSRDPQLFTFTFGKAALDDTSIPPQATKSDKSLNSRLSISGVAPNSRPFVLGSTDTSGRSLIGARIKTSLTSDGTQTNPPSRLEVNTSEQNTSINTNKTATALTTVPSTLPPPSAWTPDHGHPAKGIIVPLCNPSTLSSVAFAGKTQLNKSSKARRLASSRRRHSRINTPSRSHYDAPLKSAGCFLPHELVERIVSFADKCTLAKLMVVSRTMYRVAGPHLYQCLEITTENASKVFLGLIRPIKEEQDVSYRKSVLVSHLYTKNPLDRPTVPLWPLVSIESDDESQDECPLPSARHGTNKSQRRSSYTPSNHSHERKLALLGHTKQLEIVSIPSRHLVKDIVDVIDQIPRWRENRKIFPQCRECLLGTKAILQLADWQDRWIHSSHIHPLLEHFRYFATPEKLCISTPQLRFADWLDYIGPRIDTSALRLSGKDRIARRKELKAIYQNTFGGVISCVVSRLVRMLADTSTVVTIHGMRDGVIPTGIPHCRVFFSPCACKRQGQTCSQHVTYTCRVVQLGELAHRVGRWSKRSVPGGKSLGKGWELVNAATPWAFCKDEEHMRSAMNYYVKSREPSWGEHGDKIKISTVEEAEPCECCGRK